MEYAPYLLSLLPVTEGHNIQAAILEAEIKLTPNTKIVGLLTLDVSVSKALRT